MCLNLFKDPSYKWCIRAKLVHYHFHAVWFYITVHRKRVAVFGQICYTSTFMMRDSRSVHVDESIQFRQKCVHRLSYTIFYLAGAAEFTASPLQFSLYGVAPSSTEWRPKQRHRQHVRTHDFQAKTDRCLMGGNVQKRAPKRKLKKRNCKWRSSCSVPLSVRCAAFASAPMKVPNTSTRLYNIMTQFHRTAPTCLYVTLRPSRINQR